MIGADLRRGANTRGPAPVYGGLSPAMNEAGRAQGQLGQGLGAANDALGMARAAALGQGGPTLAQQQLAAGRQQGLVDQMGLAAQAQGSSLASQQRAVAGMGAANQMGLARDSAALQMQEQAAAQQAYAQQAQNLAGLGLQAHMGAQGLLQGAYGTQYQGAQDWALQQRALDQQALENRRRFGTQIASGIFELGKSIPGMIGGGGMAGG